jgi:hypothetical protein
MWNVMRGVMIFIALTSLVSCGARPLEDSSAAPDEIIAAWGKPACGDASVRTFPPDGDEAGFAKCELPINGTLGEKTVSIRIYKSKNGLKTKLATVKCGSGYLWVVGPKWYSVTSVPEVATALQDAGGKLFC